MNTVSCHYQTHWRNAGGISILYASELLAKSNGLMLGGITGVRPTEVVVLGAGIVGEFATKAAIGLGASVRVLTILYLN